MSNGLLLLLLLLALRVHGKLTLAWRPYPTWVEHGRCLAMVPAAAAAAAAPRGAPPSLPTGLEFTVFGRTPAAILTRLMSTSGCDKMFVAAFAANRVKLFCEKQ
jgi:hypothetical protein